MVAKEKLLTREEILPEFNRVLKDGSSKIQKIIKLLAKKSGLAEKEVTKIINSGDGKHTSRSEMEKSVLNHLRVGSIPSVIGRWIRDMAKGDSSYALQLAETLRETGILVIDGKNASTPLNLEAPSLSDMPSVITTESSSSSQLNQIADQFVSLVIDGLRKIPPIKIAYKSLPEFEDWAKERLTTATGLNLRKVRKWGDPVMTGLHFDVNQVKTTNFQAVGLYNKSTGFGAVSNFVYIEREDIENLWEMQFDEKVNGTLITRDMKMNWLARKARGKIYMLENPKDSWEKSPRIRWGTIALGGNLVQVEGIENFPSAIKLPGGNAENKVKRMARLVGFRKRDWKRSLDELLAEGLVHRCFSAGKDNVFGDSPQGIVYSPFFSPLDWNFAVRDKPTHFYIPLEYFEPKEDLSRA